MALFVTFSNGTDREYHVGVSVRFPDREVLSIVSVTADGDELEWIKEQFGNTIPTYKGRVVSWYGDIARCIASSLEYLDKV